MEGFFSLASSSKGNCAYLGTQQCKILIDLGISKQQAKDALASMGIHPEDIQAIFITHEHSDHTLGLRSFIKAYNTPIVCNIHTAQALNNQLLGRPHFHIFSSGTTFTFHDLTVQTFNVPHDALDPVGFVFHYQGEKLGLCTDLGFPTSWITQALYDCDYLFIESNHDPKKVLESDRIAIHKQRVLGKLGHLSNQECGKLLRDILTPKIKKIYLAHLSNECNTPELAQKTVLSAIEDRTHIVPIVALSRDITEPIEFCSLATV